METTAERLKQAMHIRNMKQKDLVEKTGISKGALSSYLNDHYVPKQVNIYKLAAALNVNEAWLMGHDVPMVRNEKAKEINDVFWAFQNEKANALNKYLETLGFMLYCDDPEHPPYLITNFKSFQLSFADYEKINSMAEAYIKFIINDIINEKDNFPLNNKER